MPGSGLSGVGCVVDPFPTSALHVVTLSVRLSQAVEASACGAMHSVVSGGAWFGCGYPSGACCGIDGRRRCVSRAPSFLRVGRARCRRWYHARGATLGSDQAARTCLTRFVAAYAFSFHLSSCFPRSRRCRSGRTAACGVRFAGGRTGHMSAPPGSFRPPWLGLPHGLQRLRAWSYSGYNVPHLAYYVLCFDALTDLLCCC